MHGSGKPREGVSTLLNETGNIQLYRVSEETRKKGFLLVCSILVLIKD